MAIAVSIILLAGAMVLSVYTLLEAGSSCSLSGSGFIHGRVPMEIAIPPSVYEVREEGEAPSHLPAARLGQRYFVVVPAHD